MRPLISSSRQMSVLVFVASLSIGVLTGPGMSQAQMTDITSSGLNTQINTPAPLPDGTINYDITGGTRPGAGANLFHSFGEFSVGNNNIANFLNETNITTENILSRVTDGNPSNIFGTIQTTNFGAANLYLINPAGVMFGPTASLNVGGSFVASTADYLRLADGMKFNALPGLADAVLSIAPVAAFGFLGPTAASISIQRSALEVPTGKTLSFIGGDFTFVGDPQFGLLFAPSGKVEIASVASSGEVVPSAPGAPIDLKVDSFKQLGKVEVSQLATMDVTGTPGGTVIMRGGRLTIDQSVILAGTTGSVDAPNPSIDIKTTEDIVVTNQSIVQTFALGAGRAGDLRISGGSLAVDGASTIDAFTLGSGRGGNLDVQTGTLTMSDGGQIRVITTGDGQSGDLSISANSITFSAEKVKNLSITGLISDTTAASTGNGGNLTVTAQSLDLLDGGQIFTRTSGTGSGGLLDVNADNILISGLSPGGLPAALDAITRVGTGKSGGTKVTTDNLRVEKGGQISTSTLGPGSGGSLEIRADSILLSTAIPEGPTGVFSQADIGNGGAVRIVTNELQIKDGAVIDTSAFRSGRGGDIELIADKIQIGGVGVGDNPSRVVNQSNVGASGSAGTTMITAGSLEILGGGEISVLTGGTGGGGALIVNADSIRLSGVQSDFAARISATTESSGTGGNVQLVTKTLEVLNGAQIVTGARGPTSTGDSGAISINADRVVVSGIEATRNSAIFADSQGSGKGGDIRIDTSDLEVSNGGNITATSFGSGNAGNIDVKADRALLDGRNNPQTGVGLKTRAVSSGNGGSIRVEADSLTLKDGGQINAGTDGLGNAGSVEIHAGQLSLLQTKNFHIPTFIGTTTTIVDPRSTQSANAGSVLITSDSLAMQRGLIASGTLGSGSGGSVDVVTNTVAMKDNSVISTSTFLTEPTGGNAGSVRVTARDALTVGKDSFISSATFGGGNAGRVDLDAGRLELTDGAHIDSRTDGSGEGGRVTIKANEVALSDLLTLISANSGPSATGSAGDIFINAATVNVKNGAGITSLTSGIGDAGTVTIKATDSVTIAGSETTVASSSLPGLPQATRGDAGQVTIEAPTVTLAEGGAVTTTTFSSGRGGDVVLDTNTLTITNGGQISSGTGGSGDGGTVSIRAKDSVSIVGQDKLGNKSNVAVASISGSGDAGFLAINSNVLSLEGGLISALTSGQGKAGAIELAAQTISVTNDSQISSSTLGTGEGGTITIKGTDSSMAKSLTISQSLIDSSTVGNGNAGGIALAAKTIVLDNDASLSASTGDPTGLFTGTGQGRAGDIVVTGGTLQVLNGATVDSSTFGAGAGGTVHITATERVIIAGQESTGFGSGITSLTASSGNAGQIEVTAPVIEMSDGGIISTNTGGAGNAGAILLKPGQLSMTGGARLTSRAREQSTGTGGNISVFASQLVSLSDGAVISATSDGPGNAGSVTLQLEGLFSSQGSTVSTSAAQGAGGNVSITAGNMNLNSGTTISAESAGSKDAGSIALTSATDLLMRNSTVSTSAAEASGGGIKLTAPNLIRLVDSNITSSVEGSTTTVGGNITIDPLLVVIQNSQIRANATAGAGGNINIAASGAVLVDPNSRIDASAGPAGIRGSVNINAPIQVLSGALVPLNLAYSQAALSGDRCAADPTGQFSSFVQAGRDGVPQVPGALSPSPLSFLETLSSGSLGSQSPNWAAARLGLDSVSVDDSTRYRFHSACHS